MNYWLIKSEPTCYSIDDLRHDSVTLWSGVRNYQARNFLKEMKKGDRVLFYHSSCELVGVYGVGKVSKDAVPESDPRWYAPEIAFVKKFVEPYSLFHIKADKDLQNMMVAQQGSRLSVMPVEKVHFEKISRSK